MGHTDNVNNTDITPSALNVGLAAAGVFKGAHGLEGLLNADDFWERQPYGTRFYYGDGIADYLHRDVLRAAIQVLAANVRADQPL